MSPIPILTYHQIDVPPPSGAPYRSLVVTPAAFARQMALLKALGYQGMSISQLEPYLRGERSGKVVGITLDDGFANNLEHALPVLRHCGFSSTCYVVSGQLGGLNVWDRGKGVPPQMLMDAAQLKAWLAGGQEVGAHSRSHLDLLHADAATAREEIAGCKRDLEQCLEAEVRHFCYPYGSYRPEHAAMVREAGYATAATTRRGRVRQTDDRFELPRIPVPRTTTRLLLWLKLATGYEDRRRT